MQFKKIMAAAGAGLMGALTIAAPALASTVTEVGSISDLVSVTDSTATFPIFVVGAAASTADVAGALNLAVKLAGESKSTSAVTTTGTGETVSNGVKIETSGNKLVPYESIQAVKTVLTSSDLPTMLGGGTYQSGVGNSYGYKQYMYISGEASNALQKVVYERPNTESAPRIGFKETGSSIMYTYKLTFSTPVNFANGDSDLEGTTINFLGGDFVISDATTTGGTVISDLTLLGGKSVVTVNTAGDTTVTTSGTDYTVHLDGVATETISGTNYLTAVGDINGESFSLRAGQTTTLSDGTLVAAVKVIQGKVGEADYAKIAIGADKIKLFAASNIQKGSTTVADVASEISSTGGTWSYLTLTHTPSTTKWLTAGEKIADPFASTFDISFTGISPAFDDTTNRQTITFTPSGYNVLLTYDNAAGVTNQMYTLYYDGGTWRWMSSSITASASNDNSYRDVVFDESRNISAYEQDYFVIGKGGFSHVLQFTSFTPTSSELIFTDEGGNSITATNSTNYADLIVDGSTYQVVVVDVTKKIVNVDLNGDRFMGNGTVDAASYTYADMQIGAQYSYLTPKLITSGQGGLYFYNGSKGGTAENLATAAGDWVYPDMGLGGIRLANESNTIMVQEYTAANTWTSKANITASLAGLSPWTNYIGAGYSANIDYMVNIGGNISDLGAYNYTISLYNATGASANKGFVMVQEANEGGSTYNWVYVPVNWYASASRTTTETPMSDDSNFDVVNAAITGSSTEYTALTTYGTKVDWISNNLGGSQTWSYPDTYTYANLYILEPTGIVSSTGAAGEVTTDTVIPITGDIVKLDTEMTESDKTTNDLILVGGPCIHTLVNELADAGKFTYTCDTWPGEDFAAVTLVEDAFAEGYTVLVIAGTRAGDTDLGARAIQTGALDDNTESSVKITGSVSSPTVTAM